MSASTPPKLDHLVIAAATLAEGVAWCEATLGLTPGPGGEHALYGTHNRLLQLDFEGAGNAYLEIIAINPGATPTQTAPLKRCFDLDAPDMMAHLSAHGPQLIHWVVQVPHLAQALSACSAVGMDRGAARQASRPTPGGLLEWQISVRDDGQRLLDGCMPTLIQWGDTHPATSMSKSGLQLRQLSATHPEAALLTTALKAVGLQQIKATQGPAQLLAQLDTPKGLVRLASGTPLPPPRKLP